jgi:hypothetical protein
VAAGRVNVTILPCPFLFSAMPLALSALHGVIFRDTTARRNIDGADRNMGWKWIAFYIFVNLSTCGELMQLVRFGRICEFGFLDDVFVLESTIF